MKWRADEIELAITDIYDIRQNLIVPNVSWGFGIRHEADLLIVRKSGYCIEIEIKVTIADLRADFKKKHLHLDRRNRIKELYYALPADLIDKATPIIEKGNPCAGIISCRYDSRIGWQPYRATYIKHAVAIPNHERLTKEDRYTLARLGTIKLWKTKQALADRQLPIPLREN